MLLNVVLAVTMASHAKFLSRTVFLNLSKAKSSRIEAPPLEVAYKELTYKLNQEKILAATKRNRYYEKQWMRRRRLAYEECRSIQNQELQRKLNFLIRQNRREPWCV